MQLRQRFSVPMLLITSSVRITQSTIFQSHMDPLVSMRDEEHPIYLSHHPSKTCSTLSSKHIITGHNIFIGEVLFYIHRTNTALTKRDQVM